jgi:D-cysteine desulfhydrase
MPLTLPPRIPLARLPTPLEHASRLSGAWGGPQIWIKRDDLTGFGLSGNKVRKLEFHLAAARSEGADTIITCGAVQSNHSRATALSAARLGLRCVLVLRRSSLDETEPPRGNYLLDRLAGASIRVIARNEWDQRTEIMNSIAVEHTAAGHRSWVIPEGASDALGMWGFVVAMQELADQLVQIPGKPPTIWHAASSGGTTAGIGWAAERLGLDVSIAACSVGDPIHELRDKVRSIWTEAASSTGTRMPGIDIDYIDRHIGGGYGVSTAEELDIQAEATSLTGAIFDPTYTGKALVGVYREIASGTYTKEDNVVFWHTGGGFAAFAHDFSRTSVAEALDAGSA